MRFMASSGELAADLDSFLRSGSRTKPGMATSANGSEWNSISARARGSQNPMRTTSTARALGQLLAGAKEQFVGREADEPLAVGDDLEGTGAVLPELHRMGDGSGLADQVAGGGEELDDPLLGLNSGLADQLAVGPPGLAGVHRLPLRLTPLDVTEAAVVAHDRSHGQAELPPPH